MYETLFVIGPPRTLYDMVPFIVVGMLLVAYGVWNRERQDLLLWVAPILIGVILAVLGSVDTVASQRRHVQPWEGHDLGDVVRLGDEEFVIDHFRSTPAYHQTIAYGGVLREGAAVRVWLYRGAVLRIDSSKAEGK
ncbi:MAG: hypothetical protein KC492_37160 [Myxococcales bacterium]|nr:hypothetical protein [Myxococcales bacterium]